MLRSLYSGISGMKNFQTKLDVIGNNIANVNTYGFKKSRTTFKDLISQQIAGAGAATQNRGGINAQQVGLGTQISSIDTIHTAGATQTTSRTLDLALTGDGFFPVGTIKDVGRVGIDRGNQLGNNKFTGTIDRAMDVNYTRAGNLYLDDRGYIVTSEGMFLIGETGEKTLPTDNEITQGNNALAQISAFGNSYKDTLDALKVLEQRTNDLLTAYQDYDDAYTTWQNAGSPLPDPNATPPVEEDVSYKALTNAHDALSNIYDNFQSTGVSIFNNSLQNFDDSLVDLNVQIGNFNMLEITSSLSPVNADTALTTNDYPISPAYQNANGSFNDLNNNEEERIKQLASDITNFKINMDKIGQSVAQFESVAEDLITPKWSDSLSGDAGFIQIPLTAQSFSVSPDGTVTFINEKGELNVAGQIRIANFANAGGLEKVGGNLFRESGNSGTVDQNNNGIELDELLIPGSDGASSIVSGALEMSNVDLSEEFTEMIVAQRGFQSNTKIITTSDEILQEIMGLKR
ncbi:flagellar hook-basal body complex protein [Metabacillus halosaccharovorans]|uniref:flagellar hook-basal body complex protein n=1 Tax=Metabacillus halosaccharovorans TaxID=930124 RepID=UPI0020425F47|nr:flagellar hook-basal body complex protein [Metabacillus halosaccharovorans]MCM3441093.1 flagellar hook-basal body complex protein [Metabacillus halosaccharovorans]